MHFIPAQQDGLDKMSVRELDKYRDSLLSLKQDMFNDKSLASYISEVEEETKRVEIEIMWKDKERNLSELN